MPIAAITPLLTLDEANAWLGLESDGGEKDALVTAAIQASSDAIANYIGYNPNSTTYTAETQDGQDTRAVYTLGYPIISVASVSIGGSVIPASSYVVKKEFITLKDGAKFPAGTQNVSITYTAGYASIPGILKQACQYATKAVYSAQSVDPNVASESVPGVYSASYAMASAPGRSGSIAGTLPMNAQLLLDPFRRVIT
jgi:hypothetical protein